MVYEYTETNNWSQEGWDTEQYSTNENICCGTDTALVLNSH